MPNTAHGYPYPDPTEFVKDGAGAIQALANKIEADYVGGRASIGLLSTAAPFSPAANADVLINNWNATPPAWKIGVATDISYAGGLVTVAAGLWRAMFSCDWPSAGAAYRNRQLFQIGGASVARGRVSYQAVSGAGAQSLVAVLEEYFPTGGTIAAAINTSTAGLTGVQPLSFVVSRQ